MKYIKVNLKPLSVNKAWKGKRIKTTDYSKFEKSCLLILPIYETPKCDLELFIHYGFSSKGSDIDNPNKMVIDILSKKYGFNDNLIYRLIVTKEIVAKGNEFFEFSIKGLK